MESTVLITKKNTNFNCKDMYMITDLNKVISTYEDVQNIRESEVQRHIDLGYSVDMSSKNAFGCYKATKQVNEYEKYTVQYLSQVKKEHKQFIKK